ncbi:MAG: hypothetical protein ACTHMK_13920 [Dyella sp.]|uniref:hypothetical protein n=1 Tax=Dyella sp. TaxID=1869338 RepID=UPI003F81F9BE
MKNKIEDLRNHLFATIEGLLDAEKPMDLERAKTVAEVAQVMVNSAKVEVEFLRATDSVRGTGFIPDDAKLVGAPRSPLTAIDGGARKA